jgi:hypothetical protein
MKSPLKRLALFVRNTYAEASTKTSLFRLMLSGYNYQLSTRANYGSTKDESCGGEFADARALIDSNHHGYYVKSRQEWQDKFLRSMFRELRGISGSALPWLIFTCGAMGSGKTFVQRWCKENKFLVEWELAVIIDSDSIKEAMPEWPGYLAHNPHNAGSSCHEESVYVQEIGHECAMSRSLDVCVDGSLSDWQWNSKLFSRIRAKYPHYRIAIIAVHVEESTARRRCAQRFISEGRAIPNNAFVRSLAATSTSLDSLGPMADAVVHISNDIDGEKPVLVKSDVRVRGKF